MKKQGVVGEIENCGRQWNCGRNRELWEGQGIVGDPENYEKYRNCGKYMNRGRNGVLWEKEGIVGEAGNCGRCQELWEVWER